LKTRFGRFKLGTDWPTERLPQPYSWFLQLSTTSTNPRFVLTIAVNDGNTVFFYDNTVNINEYCYHYSQLFCVIIIILIFFFASSGSSLGYSYSYLFLRAGRKISRDIFSKNLNFLMKKKIREISSSGWP
jgi:hypothetical protein